ncbi:hypothetical protein AgCh_038132 [Apium graveolens]
MTKLPIRKRLENVPQFSGSVDAAVAEFIIVYGSGTPNLEVEEQQRDDVLLLIGDRIVDPMERPNAGPDDVHIKDVVVEDVVLEGIVVEKDLVEDPNKTEEMTAEESMTMVRATTRGKAKMVVNALSIKERLKMKMSLGELIRDFEKMEIEVKGIQEERFKDNLRGFTRRKVIFKILKSKNVDKGNMTQLGPKIKDVLRKAKEVADTLKDEVVERKMLGPAVVQRTKDIIDLIRGRLVVVQDGHKKYVDLTRKDKE